MNLEIGVDKEYLAFVLSCITDSHVAKTSGLSDIELVQNCNRLLSGLNEEIRVTLSSIKTIYKQRFPELENFRLNPLDYSRIVLAIGNNLELLKNSSSLLNFLSGQVYLALTMAAATTGGHPLSSNDLAITLEKCGLVVQLEEYKVQCFEYIQRQMEKIAPNLSALIGVKFAAQLLGDVGGLKALSAVPSNNLQVIGAKRADLAGFSSSGANNPHTGHLFQHPLVQALPSDLRMKGLRVLAAKSALAIRIDASKPKDNSQGLQLLTLIQEKFQKMQEPLPLAQPKPLPVPKEGPKKKRGGRRVRKLKELYAPTELSKARNRIAFNQPEEEIIVGDTVQGLGMKRMRDSQY